MSDYISIKNTIQQLNDNDRVVLNNEINDESPNLLRVANEHKFKFTLFSNHKKAENDRIKQENIDAAKAVADAIKNRFGKEVQSQLLNKIIESGTKLTGKRLKVIFASLDKFEKDVCKNIVRDRISQYSMSKNDVESINYENRMLRKIGLAPNKVSDLFNQTDYRISAISTTFKDLVGQKQVLDESKQKLAQLSTTLDGALGLQGEDEELREYCLSVKENIEKITSAINEKQELIDSELAQDPHLIKNVKVAFDNVFKGAILTLNAIGERFSNEGQEIPEEIREFAIKMDNQREQLFADKNDTDIAGADILTTYKEFRVGLKKDLANLSALFKRYNLNAKLSKKEITELYNQNFVKTLNNNPESWKVVTKKITIPAFGKTSTVTANIIPAVNLSLLKNQMTNIRGVSSNDRNNKHASNLAVTNLVNSEGKVIFSGVRHGANCAFGIEDENQRKQVNAERAKEVMLAGLESRADLKAQALEGNVVELPIVSTALLSPGKLVGPATNDAKFLKEQNDAWRNACDNEGICTITIKDDDGNDKIIRVKPKVIKFNFGINFLSHTVLGRMVSLGGGWGKSDSMIKEGIKELIGKPQKNNPNNIADDSLVGAYLQNNPNIDERKETQIRLLVRQIREMVKNEDYKKNAIDPSALPARITLLAYLVGAVPCFNCKSGKDRTGQVDAAVKALAFELDAGKTPHINPADDKEEKKVNMTMLRNCGNFEMQKYNTGFEGYKLEHAKNSGWYFFIGLKGLADLFYNDESIKYFKGTSQGNIV